MSIKFNIMTFVGFYLPGYKAGGQLRSIANMVGHLSDDFVFWIVTRDRDLGDTSPYTGIQPNKWHPEGGAMVYYLSLEYCTVRGMANLISNTPCDVLYLNSFFEPVFTIKPLLARRLGWLPNKPVIVAPRGEFSTGAIKLKYLKKWIYIQIAKLTHLYDNVTWQASSEREARDVVRVLNASLIDIHIAIDLPRCVRSDIPIGLFTKPNEEDAVVRVVFLSRISPKKNLDYALRVLFNVKASVIFDIYGPAENSNYWEYCKELMKQLPSNVAVNYYGSVHSEQVASIFSRYDLFFFPTLGENYGHVIAESLSVGTPVLLSDHTPWRDMQAERLGWDFALDSMDNFVRTIEDYVTMSATEKHEWRQYIIDKTVERLANPQVFEDNRDLFRCAINKWMEV